MTNRKNNNSILFLTTLGVYLGLVLVGATPVLGHAATTRHFELRDEIEFADDLDNKPDEQSVDLSFSVSTYVEDVEYFLAGLQNLGSRGEFKLDVDTFEVAQSTQLPCVAANKVGSYTAKTFVNENKSLRPWLERLSKQLTDGYSLADCLPHERFAGQEATDSRFVFKLDKSDLSVEIAVKKQSPYLAGVLLRDLGNAFKSFNANQKDLVRLRIFENTFFKAENDQVFVVTRLARAALDPLLAEKAR